MGFLRTLQTEYTLALGMITIAPCCGKNQVLKISNQGPPRPQPSHYQLCHFLVLEKQLLSSLYIRVSGKKSPKGPGPRLLLAGPSTFLVLKRSCVPFSLYQGLWESLRSSAQLSTKQYKHIHKAVRPSLPSILRTQSLSLKTSITRNPTFSPLPSPWQVAFYCLIK